MNFLFSDPRRRTLAALAGLALLSLILAVLALYARADLVAPKYPPHAFLPGFADKLHQVAQIRIESKKDGVVEIAFKPMTGWVLPGRDNYPASFDTVRKVLMSLATLQTIEPKTARPEWYGYVDLDAPPKGEGVSIVVSDDNGRILASLIVGRSEDIGDPNGAVGLFVRNIRDPQSWLVRSPSDLHIARPDWMERKIVDIDRARITMTAFRPLAGASFALSRARETDADFKLAATSRKGAVADPALIDEAGAALAGLSFDDVRPLEASDFDDKSARVVTETFDGLIVGVDVVHEGRDYWARIAASAAPGRLEAAKEARSINGQASGWAFKIDPAKGAAFTTTLDSLAKPAGK